MFIHGALPINTVYQKIYSLNRYIDLSFQKMHREKEGGFAMHKLALKFNLRNLNKSYTRIAQGGLKD